MESSIILTTFVVMFRNGSYDDVRSVPIRTYLKREPAMKECEWRNFDAAVVAGKVKARTLLMLSWMNDPARLCEGHNSLSDQAEYNRLTHLLEIQKDALALGFDGKDSIDNPYWSVVEVPHCF